MDKTLTYSSLIPPVLRVHHAPARPLPQLRKIPPRPYLLLLPRIRPRHLPRINSVPNRHRNPRNPPGLHPALPPPRREQPEPLLHVLQPFHA